MSLFKCCRIFPGVLPTEACAIFDAIFVDLCRSCFVLGDGALEQENGPSRAVSCLVPFQMCFYVYGVAWIYISTRGKMLIILFTVFFLGDKNGA